MKLSLLFLAVAAVWAQSEPSPASQPQVQTPAVKRVVKHIDFGQLLADQTVVATYEDGRKITAGELQSFLEAMPPNMAQAARRDRKAFVEQFALMHRLSEMAEKAKLDEQSPTREALAFNRMYLLMNAQLHEVLTNITVPDADAQSFYDTNKDRFKQVKVKAIYIRFGTGSSGAGAERTEAEAQAKIESLRRAAAAGGANFVKLAKDNSEDPTSVAKDGDFGTFRSSDNLPDAIRKAIFALKAGDVSEPVKQPNGFYLFLAEQVTPQPFADVKEEIGKEIKEAQFKHWMEEASRSLNLKIVDESFITQSGGAASK